MPKYTVVDTREISSLTPTGTERKMYRVWITTENGARGTVDVRPADWNADALTAILQEKAAQLDLAYTVGGAGGGL